MMKRSRKGGDCDLRQPTAAPSKSDDAHSGNGKQALNRVAARDRN
ncbi:unnamed protein product, partial [Amoebophrya sp. A120]|eukprot:GSA120T00005314001.1